MARDRAYFLCGIGGSGMLPLALILRSKGFDVAGSDRALDQGRTPEKFAFLHARGVALFPQDGSGIRAGMTVIASAAVENSVPDVVRARDLGARVMTRAELLAKLFNAAPRRIGIGGTSGKSTTTGMIGWILHRAGRDPTVMNGAVMKNFITPDLPFAGAVIGKGDLFVSELDESDGSIARFTPGIAVLNNLSLDHKSLDELRVLFRDFIAKAAVAVVNRDNAETAALAAALPRERVITYSLADGAARLLAAELRPAPDGIGFQASDSESGARAAVRLRVPGRHNVANALAALGAALAAGVSLDTAAEALGSFRGISRRLDVIGTANGITVIDDFAHNPDKIAATLATLHDFPGRLLVLFQPHGFGPLRLMKDAFIAGFAHDLAAEDVLLMPDPVYFGGTVDRSVTSRDIVTGIAAQGRAAFALPDRAHCADKLIDLARPGDRIVIMGARDDTLTHLAAELIERLRQSPIRPPGPRRGR